MTGSSPEVDPAAEGVSLFSTEAWSARLVVLLIAHVLLTTACAGLALFWREILLTLPVIELYQFILVSMWVMLGPWDIEGRVLGLLLFNVYVVVTTLLAASLAVGPPGSTVGEAIGATILLSASVSLICGLPFLLLYIWLELRRVADPVGVDQSFTSRMGIRHLMGMTLICGLIVATTGALKEDFRPPALVAGAILLAPWLVAAIAFVWAILSPRFSWIRLAIAVLVNASVAALSAAQFGAGPAILLWMLLGNGVLMASLFVLRSDGYRLLRRESRSSERDAGELEVATAGDAGAE